MRAAQLTFVYIVKHLEQIEGLFLKKKKKLLEDTENLNRVLMFRNSRIKSDCFLEGLPSLLPSLTPSFLPSFLCFYSPRAQNRNELPEMLVSEHNCPWYSLSTGQPCYNLESKYEIWLQSLSLHYAVQFYNHVVLLLAMN